MILSFNCRETERIWQGKLSRKFPADVQDRALRAHISSFRKNLLKNDPVASTRELGIL